MAAGLEQQRHVGDTVRRIRRKRRKELIDPGTYRGMNDRFEITPRTWISEHDRTEAWAIERAVSVQNAIPEASDDRSVACRSRRNHFTGDDVGVDERDAGACQPARDVAFARRNASRQRYSLHSVLERARAVPWITKALNRRHAIRLRRAYCATPWQWSAGRRRRGRE